MRWIQLLLSIALLIGCNSPSATPEPPRKVNITIEVPPKPAVVATDEPTFTPIPASFTPASTNTITPTSTLIATEISTAAATKMKSTATAVKLLPTRTLGPTRTLRPTSIPTIFLPPTDTPAPVVVQPTSPPAQSCCKVCTGSKACGNSCISNSKTCHQPPGCACQG